jgi:predicted nuclease of predicted toxin-antitoxin system
MRLLLDENLDWRLGRDLPGHQTESVPLLGWAGIQNGELLAKAAKAAFDVLVTMDSNMVHQQNIGKYNIAVVALRARSNRLADTRPLMPALLDLLPQLKPGTVTFVAPS